MTISNALQKSVKAPTEKLQLSLNDISATTQLFSRASRLRPRLREMLRWENLQADERRLVQDFIGHREANENAIALSLVVVCYGLLEKFVRELLERTVKVIDSELEDFNELPEQLTSENIYRTGIALQSIKSNSPHVTFDFALLARNLGTCYPNSDSYTLNASCFSIGHGILTPRNMEQIFQRIGVKIDWDRFGSNTDLKKLLKEPRTRDCAKAIRNFLEELVKKRNIVAHSGGLEIVVGESEFEAVTEIIPIFCKILVEQVSSELEKRYG